MKWYVYLLLGAIAAMAIVFQRVIYGITVGSMVFIAIVVIAMLVSMVPINRLLLGDAAVSWIVMGLNVARAGDAASALRHLRAGVNILGITTGPILEVKRGLQAGEGCKEDLLAAAEAQIAGMLRPGRKRNSYFRILIAVFVVVLIVLAQILLKALR